MDALFSWWISKPDTQVNAQDWTSFLSMLGYTAALLILVGTVVILFLYNRAAMAWKPGTMREQLGPYTPMRWLGLALAFGLIEAIVCAARYAELESPQNKGELGVALRVGVFVAAFTFAIAYLMIRSVPSLTPVIARDRIR